MDFPKKIEEQISGIQSWFHSHFHKHHCHCGALTSFDHFTHHMHWVNLVKFLPEELVTEIHTLCLKSHELFLSEHFKFAKKIKELKHKKDILHLDIAEHCHLKGSEFNKGIVSESLKELRKTQIEYHDLIDKEWIRFSQVKKETEDRIYEKIQEYLKK